MPISESDPFARNLMVSSLLMIAFYWGGGTLPPNQSLTLPVTNLQFTNTAFLGWMAWALWGWFLFRFFQMHGFSLSKDSERDLQIDSCKSVAIKWAVRQLKLEVGLGKWEIDGTYYRYKQVRISNWNARLLNRVLQVEEIVFERLQENQPVGTHHHIATHSIELAKPQAALLRAKVFAIATLRNPGLLSQYFPYVLSAVVAITGINSLFN